MDSSDPLLQRVSQEAALHLGSEKALARFHRLLRQGDTYAAHAAGWYLIMVHGEPIFRMAGLSDKALPACAKTLLVFMEKSDEKFTKNPYVAEHPEIMWLDILSTLDLANYHFWDGVDILCNSPSATKRMAAIRYYADLYFTRHFYNPGQNLAEPEKQAAWQKRASFFRTQVETHPEIKTRATAMRSLGWLQDTSGVPLLERYLKGEERELRLAAAEALLFMHQKPLQDTCIECLVDDDVTTNSQCMVRAARSFGIKNPGQLGQPLWDDPDAMTTTSLAGYGPGNVAGYEERKKRNYDRLPLDHLAVIPSTKQMRERQKAALREWFARE
jgi:hypothetical protein